MSPFLGQIILWSAPFVPENWKRCHGQSLSVQENQALYSIIGNTYGGDFKNFNLPDLRGRMPISTGQADGVHYRLGAKGGGTTDKPTIAQLPADDTQGTRAQATGQGIAQNNMPPYLVLNYIICVSGGDYPVRDEYEPQD